MFATSPVQQILFEQRRIFVKRDDLLHPDFSGNKARKFYHFLSKDYSHITHLVGSGSAQANSLYSMSVLAKQRGWRFDYYVSHLNDFIIQHPMGNYAAAIANGANIIDVSQLQQAFQYQQMHLDDVVKKIIEANYSRHCSLLHIPEGGRCEYAESGLAMLATEVIDWAQLNNLTELKVFLPSGTGTTAAYLNKQLKLQLANNNITRLNLEVITCSTVGGDEYLIQQFSELVDKEYYPTVVNDGHKYHFGKLTKRCFDMWKSVCVSGIEFELLYDPVGFLVLKDYLAKHSQWQGDIVYLHQGGVLGNQTMLPRYQRKFAK
ncbi:1-aminocyclopropane-1-carboxylate deaminase/D-cysteine desulfhydrase [Shewanella ulleungensis]|uniref:1-aminocyclopropane-1-carboxylate deaminase n=1 Tax=Shewanella ulleungensis TaxID=2282699 RepID=A0ABQ2QBS6_9GAMM|nr:1-aminocyclopropane-1-carboxylate deaminase/D-cysteine desulfhydrase [Shewanella ulleungensis]MCL1149122.1 1-aminocyclopropane-1-carboxylate deaminase/D-cysteine desulfhydrase [Shewanella ulleungensis]GGP73439.1 1-aminocyclopropane-1-carboxylate deaminase [Shewanella ulleungensis]